MKSYRLTSSRLRWLQYIALLGGITLCLNAVAIAQDVITSAGDDGAYGLALDGSGELYIAGDSAIYVLSSDDTLTTLNSDLDNAIAVAPSSSTYFFMEYGDPSTLYNTSSVVDITTEDDTDLAYAAGPALDSSGNIYVIDGNYGWLYEVSSSTGDTTTLNYDSDNLGVSVVGGPVSSASFESPDAIAIDSDDNIYVADGNCIRVIYNSGTIPNVSGPTAGHVYTVGGDYDSGGCEYVTGGLGDGGPATSANFSSPAAITVDSSGNIFVADTYNNEIREISASNGYVYDVLDAGGSPCTDNNLCYPQGLAVTSYGLIYFTNSDSSDIYDYQTY